MGNIGSGNGVRKLLFHAAAKGFEGNVGLLQLRIQFRAFHGEEGTAGLYIGQAQLTQHIEPRHCPRGGIVEALTKAVGDLLGSGVNKRYIVKAQLFTGVAQKVQALVQTVQQGELQLRAENFQNQPRKASAGAHINECPGAKISDVQQGGGGLPVQYVRGAEVLAAVRRAYPETRVSVAGHSLGGGIAAYSVLELPSVERVMCRTYNAAGISVISLQSFARERVEGAKSVIANVRSKGDPVSAIPGTQLVGAIYEVDNLRFANHSIDGLLVDMRRRAAGRRAGWLKDLMDD